MLFAIAVVLLAWAAWALGQWQFHRLDERKHDNQIVATNLNAPPVPVDDVLSPDRAPSAPGRVAARHRARHLGRPALRRAEVPDPRLRRRCRRRHPPGHQRTGRPCWSTGAGCPPRTPGRSRPKLPPVTDGQVTVTGWVRRDATGERHRVSDLSTRAISSARIAEVMPYPLYRGFLDLAAESPAPATALGAGRAARRHQQRTALLLRAAVVVLRSAGGLRVLLPGLGRAAPAAGQASQEGRSERPEHAAVHGQHRPADEG